MPVIMLTQAVIDSGLKCLPGQGHTEYCDNKVRGLFADITSSKSAKATWNYRFKENGKTRTRRLGAVSEMTLEDARKQVEPPRYFRRLHSLRGLSHEEVTEVFT